MIETPIPDSVSAVQNLTNATRDVESEYETGQGKIREIVMDSKDAEPKVSTIAYFFAMNKFLLLTHDQESLINTSFLGSCDFHKVLKHKHSVYRILMVILLWPHYP